MLAGCATTQVPTQANTTESSYECIEGNPDDGWQCTEVEEQASPEVAVTTRRPNLNVLDADSSASAREPTAREAQERIQRGRFGIRLRGRPATDATNNTESEVQTPTPTTPSAVTTVEPTVATTQQATVAEEEQPQRRRGWLRIRGRGASESTAAQEPDETTQRTVATSTRTTPSVGAVSSVSVAEENLPNSAERSDSSPIASAVEESMSGRVSSQTVTEIEAIPVPVRATPVPSDFEGMLGNPSNYVVQLAAFKSMTRASDFIRQFPALSLSRLQILSNGQPFFIVISGIYPSRGEAQIHSEVLMESYNLDRPYIRTVGSIQRVGN